MSESERVVKNRFGRLASAFTLIAMLLAIAVLSVIVLNFAGRLESFAPAEFRLLIDILKNRFFR